MHNTTQMRQNWLRVSRERPCLVCQKPDWCLVSADGSAAICARVQSNTKAGDAGWLHRFDGKSLPTQPRPSFKDTVQSRLAPVERRDGVYRVLLGALPLSAMHSEHLTQRGLTPKQVASLEYRSLPRGGRWAVVRQLQHQGYRLGGVPGFFMECSEVKLSGAPGILLPVRDAERRIQAFQVRVDHPGDGGKYRWISSADRHLGCSPGVPIHVARPEGAGMSDVWVTEGTLKADIAALRLNRVVLAVAGVGNWRGVPPLVRRLRPLRVVVAFDMDKNRNSFVRRHVDELIACFAEDGVRVFEADWNADFKGIDDLVTGRP